MPKEKFIRGFINTLDNIRDLSSCSRRKVGAILTNQDNEIITTGYNGTPRGVLNCDEGGCPRCNNPNVQSGIGYEYCLCVHAEHNAVLSAAKQGKSVKNSILYISDRPCLQCLKLIVQCQISEVYYRPDSVFVNANNEEIGILTEYKDHQRQYGMVYYVPMNKYERRLDIYEVEEEGIRLSQDYLPKTYNNMVPY